MGVVYLGISSAYKAYARARVMHQEAEFRWNVVRFFGTVNGWTTLDGRSKYFSFSLI